MNTSCILHRPGWGWTSVNIESLTDKQIILGKPFFMYIILKQNFLQVTMWESVGINFHLKGNKTNGINPSVWTSICVLYYGDCDLGTPSSAFYLIKSIESRDFCVVLFKFSERSIQMHSKNNNRDCLYCSLLTAGYCYKYLELIQFNLSQLRCA